MQNSTLSQASLERSATPVSIPLRALLKRCYSSESPSPALANLLDGYRGLIDADRVALIHWDSSAEPKVLAVSGSLSVPNHSELSKSWKDLAVRLQNTSSNEQRNQILEEHARSCSMATSVAIPIHRHSPVFPGQLPGQSLSPSSSESASQTDPAGNSVESSSPSLQGLMILEWASEERSRAQAGVLEATIPWVRDACEVCLSRSTRSWRSWWMSRWIRWIGFGLLSLWMLQPIELWIDVDGSLQPSVQRFVFAPCDGYIEEFAARDGETLRDGDLLLRINSPDLRLQRLQLESDLRIIDEKKISLEVSANQISNREDTAALAASRIAGELEELKKKRESLVAQLQWLTTEESRLTLRASISGVVVTDPQWEEAQDRPVRRGELIARIVGTQADWRIIGHVLDWESGYVTNAFEKAQSIPEELTAQFTLASNPRETHAGTVVGIDRAFRTESSGPSLDIRISPNEPLSSPRVGATAKIRVPCGRKMRWFVWSRSLLDSIHRRFWL
jgi:multidrug efflux pump subunit AcrA (membrane-fusion protein)